MILVCSTTLNHNMLFKLKLIRKRVESINVVQNKSKKSNSF